jgi:hypothetical protein
MTTTCFHADILPSFFYDPEDGGYIFPRNVDAVLATCFHAGFSLGLAYDPENGGDMLLQNNG